MGLSTLKDLFDSHKEEILHEVSKHIESLPWSPYQQFLIQTVEGRHRLSIFVDLFSRALRGDRETFLKDQESVGYARALMEGFGPDVLTQFYSHMPDIIWKTLKNETGAGGEEVSGLCEEIQELNNVLFLGYSRIMGSYLKVREERINEKVNQLQELQRFTQEIITLREPEQLCGVILRRMTVLFGAETGTFSLYRDHLVQGVYHHPADGGTPKIPDIVERAYREKAVIFTEEGEDAFEEIDRCPTKYIVSAPIQAHGRVYGVLCLRNRTKGFRFTSKEFEFLNQFLYIVAVALENTLMLEEVERAREALSLLTGKMITIQEEERRALAADIHDTLTQALIGISYKIQFCKELPNTRPGILADQLDSLLTTVNQAIDQSRNLISSLRPDLIDTMGLIPALERHVDTFSRETGIRVEASFPEKLELSSEVNICLFRVAQEALMNVYKHAETNAAEVDLRKVNGNILFSVSDEGKGFVVSSNPPLAGDQNKLGLLSMKERVESIGGKVVIDAGTDRGCSILVTVPCSAEKPHNGQAQGDDR